MPGALRVVCGLVIALFAAAYYGIGMMFILGDVSLGAYRFSFGIFGMLGICGPVILLGLHLAFFGADRSIAARKVMVGALVATQVACLLGMAPQLFSVGAEAAFVVISGILSAGLFGWPMVRGLLAGLRSPGT